MVAFPLLLAFGGQTGAAARSRLPFTAVPRGGPSACPWVPTRWASARIREAQGAARWSHPTRSSRRSALAERAAGAGSRPASVGPSSLWSGARPKDCSAHPPALARTPGFAWSGHSPFPERLLQRMTAPGQAQASPLAAAWPSPRRWALGSPWPCRASVSICNVSHALPSSVAEGVAEA